MCESNKCVNIFTKKNNRAHYILKFCSGKCPTITTFLPAETKFWPRQYCYTCLSFCSQGGVPDHTCPPGLITPPPPQAAESGIRSTSGRYASYWNTFLWSYISPLIPDTRLKTVSTEGIDSSTSRPLQDTDPFYLEKFLIKHVLYSYQGAMSAVIVRMDGNGVLHMSL